MTKAFHRCGSECNRREANSNSGKPKAVNVGSKADDSGKSWFQKYAELNIVEREAPNSEVDAAPKVNQDTDYEIIAVTMDSGA